MVHCLAGAASGIIVAAAVRGELPAPISPERRNADKTEREYDETNNTAVERRAWVGISEYRGREC